LAATPPTTASGNGEAPAGMTAAARTILRWILRAATTAPPRRAAPPSPG
jgi:hypothetical protein